MVVGLRSQRITAGEERNLPSIDRIRQILGIPGPRQAGFIESIPFSLDDATAGSENELQAAVSGSKDCVDLPLVIERSNYFANIIKRSSVGDTSRRAVTELQEFLDENPGGLWENSWVRFPIARLSAFAKSVLDSDLLVDKNNPNGRPRGDANKFLYREQDQQFLRVPISYILKLSLADIIGSQEGIPEIIRRTGTCLMNHLLNDNTSPETFSFHVVPLQLATGSVEQ